MNNRENRLPVIRQLWRANQPAGKQSVINTADAIIGPLPGWKHKDRFLSEPIVFQMAERRRSIGRVVSIPGSALH